MMRKVIEFSVYHPLFVNLFAGFMIIAGIVSILTIRREAFPNINYDMVTITTPYYGAPAQEIEKLISIKLEDEINEVDGIDEMTSISSEGISVIVAQIDPNEKDKATVVNDIQRAVDRVSDLPQDLKDDPIVTEIKSKNIPVINVGLGGDMPELELQELAKDLETKLLDIRGVAKIARVGWRDREMWVEVNPKSVDEANLSLEEVLAALASQNMNLPGGNLDTPESGEYLVRTIGEFETAEEIRQVIVRANDAGNWLRVKDVAEVQDTFEDDNVIEKTYGNRGITLTVIKKESADVIKVVDQVKTAVEEFRSQAPKNLHIKTFDDFSYYVKRRLNVLVSNGQFGMVLVLVSLFLFLNWRLAFFTATGVPVALAMTFFFMKVFGIEINLITMLGLIIVLGMDVDDAIVISENYYQHLETGKSRKQAAIDAASEVAGPIMSSVLTTIVAFIPLFFMKGIIGKFMFEMPIVVIVALLSSLLEAFIVLPSHLAEWAHLGSRGKKVKQNRVQAFLARFDLGFRYARIRYLRTLRWIIHHRYKALGILMALFVFAFLLNKFAMKFVLFPSGMIEEFFIRTKAPIGTSLEDNEKKMRRIEELVKALPAEDLESFITQVGVVRENVTDPYSNRGTHVGQLHVFLTPEKDRKQSADQIIDEIRKKTEPFKDQFTEINFEKVRAGPPVGKPVSVRLRGDDFKMLEEAAELVKAELFKMAGLKDINDDYDAGKTELRVIVNTEEAKKAYLTVEDIARTIRTAIDGGLATTIQKTDEEIEVLVRYPKSYRSSKEIFEHLFVPNSFGRLIALSKVAQLEEYPGVQVVKRFDRKRMIQVFADLDEKKITPVEVERRIKQFYQKNLKDKYPNLLLDFGGEQEETKESFADLAQAFLLTLLLIFLILALQFNSVMMPALVMTTIPIGLMGVIFAFFLHGKPFSFMALLGVIGLNGVVVNNAIVLVDCIQELRKKGWGIDYAVYQAGRRRLRPVFLTSLTTLFGLMPTAYGIGGSDPFIKPMALSLSWGLVVATLLALVVVPGIYLIIEDVKFFGSKMLRLLFEKIKNKIKVYSPK